MDDLASHGLLDEVDGLNPARALILQAYYALRRAYPPAQIGVQQIAAWIKFHEPAELPPSDSLIQLTLHRAKVVHRGPGRPRGDRATRVAAPPFLGLGRLRFQGRAQR
jgi:hypothetical protein